MDRSADIDASAQVTNRVVCDAVLREALKTAIVAEQRERARVARGCGRALERARALTNACYVKWAPLDANADADDDELVVANAGDRQ